MALTDTIPPITGIDDPAQARVLLYQAGRSVHAPLDNVGLAVAADYLPLSGGTLTGALTTNGQIVFPATANPSVNANTLDDYEKGLWTPALKFSGASVGMTFTSQQGRYQKVGNTVHAWGWFTLNAKGSSTGGATITGLPFTASSVISFYGGSVTYLSSVTANNLGVGVSGTATILTYVGNANMTDALFPAGASIMFSLSYEV